MFTTSNQDVEALPRAARLPHYQEWAAYAMREANVATDPALRDGYIRLAAGWRALISEILSRGR